MKSSNTPQNIQSRTQNLPREKKIQNIMKKIIKHTKTKTNKIRISEKEKNITKIYPKHTKSIN